MTEKRIALITGANRGIGRKICRQLAQQNVHVILTSRDEAKGAAARDALAAAGLDVVFCQLDVTNAASVAHLAEWVEEAYGRLHILINNTGIYIDDQHSLLTVDIDLMRRTMEVNAFGPLMLNQALVPLLKLGGNGCTEQSRSGRIVNVSSGISELGNLGPNHPAYRTSKIVLNIHTRILAGELRGAGILVNAMCPGWVRTDMGGPGAPVSVEDGADTAVWLATLSDGGPTGKFFRNRQEIPW